MARFEEEALSFYLSTVIFINYVTHISLTESRESLVISKNYLKITFPYLHLDRMSLLFLLLKLHQAFMSIRAEQPPHLKAAAELRSSPMAVAIRLKELRAKRELSQAGLAKLAGVSQQTVGHIETCRVDSPRHLEVLAEALGVHPHYLRTGRMPGVPFFDASDLKERSAYPRPDSSYGLEHPMLEPHIPSLGAVAFALTVPDDACSAAGAPQGSIVVVTPEYSPGPGSLIVVHYRGGPTIRHYRDTIGEPEYVPDNSLHATLNATTAEYIGLVVEIRRLLVPYSK